MCGNYEMFQFFGHLRTLRLSKPGRLSHTLSHPGTLMGLLGVVCSETTKMDRRQTVVFAKDETGSVSDTYEGTQSKGSLGGSARP